MKILLINIARNFTQLAPLLNKEGIKYEYADDFAKAFFLIEDAQYDAIVINVKDKSCLEQCFRFLRKMSNENRAEGLIIISDKESSLDTKLSLFESGADDVLTSGFHLQELVARIKAIIKRKKFSVRDKLYFANLVVHFDEKRVYIWNTPLSLTKKEYEILIHLIAHKNKVVTKDSLAGYISSGYSDKSDTYDFLFTHVKNLRKKLQNAKAELVIKNIYGTGYQIEEI